MKGIWVSSLQPIWSGILDGHSASNFIKTCRAYSTAMAVFTFKFTKTSDEEDYKVLSNVSYLKSIQNHFHQLRSSTFTTFLRYLFENMMAMWTPLLSTNVNGKLLIQLSPLLHSQ